MIASLLIMLVNAANLNGLIKDETKQKSILYPYVEQAVPYVYEGFDLVKEAVQNATGAEENTEENTEETTEVPTQRLPI